MYYYSMLEELSSSVVTGGQMVVQRLATMALGLTG